MNWFLYIGGWFFGYWLVTLSISVAALAYAKFGGILNVPNEWYMIIAWTFVWVWISWRFIRNKNEKDIN